ncbi:MAG: glycosyltransferase [Planctomycetota bacterium]
MIAWGGAVCVTLYLASLATKYCLSRYYLARNQDDGGRAESPDVAVLRPILSGDPLLESTLRRSVSSSESPTRFWLLVDRDDHEGRRVAQAIAMELESVVQVEVCPPPEQGQNPKAAKLDHVLPLVDAPYVAVLDDDTWLSCDNLRKAIARLESGCDLYTGLPLYFSAAGFWSQLVTHFVNNNSVMTYLSLLPVTGPITINGMFYVAQTSVMRELGGWGALGEQLCDDLAIAQAFLTSGRRVYQGVTPQFLTTTVEDRGAYISLMQRWYLFAEVLLDAQPAPRKLLIVALLALPPVMLWGSILLLASSAFGLGALMIALVLRDAAIRDLMRRVCDHPPRLSWWRSIVAELVQPLHWAHAKVSKRITWRNRRIVAHADGSFDYLDQHESAVETH